MQSKSFTKFCLFITALFLNAHFSVPAEASVQETRYFSGQLTGPLTLADLKCLVKSTSNDTDCFYLEPSQQFPDNLHHNIRLKLLTAYQSKQLIALQNQELSLLTIPQNQKHFLYYHQITPLHDPLSIFS